MKQRWMWLSATLLATGLAVLPLSAQSQKEPSMNPIRITMEGTEGAAFSAHWKVTHEGETTEHIEENGTVPAEFSFEGSALEGTVTLLSDGERLEVDIQKGTNRSRSSTQGKGGTLTVSIR
ncbi:MULTISPECIES: hypothetical protein [unclassified Halomonas]|uniref:hypothetical protein n=1 Tax=unclassified Halomonas TaxID=2609666 RepID=UPI0006DAF55C|nr:MULTISPECIES: hypothetical protein [unclassified Halomonas]KPQ26773.1 MAG: hypothetical protein HLUCCO06_05775 [Halomonas sp. HL-93]SBR52543.1 hypothetical protein GA0071314_3766 [Halomonas sp. HL-93]SNY97964.1 hypothetical protein SAMN04488142_2574 [Halomonas sp. hl-4]